MEKLDLIYMLSWVIYNVVREKIEGFGRSKESVHNEYIARIKKAIRFNFRMTGSTYSGAISLLFHAASPNHNYVSIYSIETPMQRTGGKFPDPGNEVWKFLTDHDCGTHEAITQFLFRNEKVIKGWDWVDSWKVVDVSEQQLLDMRAIKKRDRR